MSPFGFTSLSAAWLFLLLVPLIVFYFLKLRRPRIEVPSLVLWQQVLNDQRVNSPFQRFKRNLLLLLQLLLLLLLILAAMQPFWRSGAEHAARLPILIDVSASMGALDEPRGDTRLDIAKERARKTIENMHKGQKICLIAFDDSARKITGFTDNKRILLEGLDQLQVVDVAGKPEDALRMAQAIAQREPFERILLLSDGNFPDRTDFELSFGIDYERLPQAGSNMAITSMNARRAGDQQWNVFVNVDGSPTFETQGTIAIFQGDEEIDRQALALEAGESDRLIFEIDGNVDTAIRAEISPAGFDALNSDNQATLSLPALRPLSIYASKSLQTYHKAMVGIPGIEVFDDVNARADFDVIVTDERADLDIPARIAYFIGVRPDVLQDVIQVGEGSADVVDWERNHPLLQHVNFSDLVIQSRSAYAEGQGEAVLEQREFAVLIHGNEGPLLLHHQRENRSEYYLMFHSDNSTLPFRIGFPIILSNLKRMGYNALGMNEMRAHKTGVLPHLQLTAESEYSVTGPDGRTRQTTSNASGLVSGVPAPAVGTYVVRNATGDIEREVPVALLSARESSLRGAETLQLNELSVAAATTTHKSDRNLWPTLTFIAFILLLLEWIFFQRRPGGWAPRSKTATAN